MSLLSRLAEMTLGRLLDYAFPAARQPEEPKVEGVPIPRKMDEDKERQIDRATSFKVKPPPRKSSRYD